MSAALDAPAFAGLGRVEAQLHKVWAREGSEVRDLGEDRGEQMGEDLGEERIEDREEEPSRRRLRRDPGVLAPTPAPVPASTSPRLRSNLHHRLVTLAAVLKPSRLSRRFPQVWATFKAVPRAAEARIGALLSAGLTAEALVDGLCTAVCGDWKRLPCAKLRSTEPSRAANALRAALGPRGPVVREDDPVGDSSSESDEDSVREDPVPSVDDLKAWCVSIE